VSQMGKCLGMTLSLGTYIRDREVSEKKGKRKKTTDRGLPPKAKRHGVFGERMGKKKKKMGKLAKKGGGWGSS